MTTSAATERPTGRSRARAVEFYFDPACPWTWLTSRWLVDAASRRDVTVTWRSLSLRELHEGSPPEQFADRLAASARAHRVIAALVHAGRNDLVGELYAALGARVHDAGEDLTVELVRAVVDEVGASPWAAALDEERWDDDVRASTEEALGLAGPDVGSPVLAHGSPRVGMFGPIVNPGPRGEQAGRLLDLVLDAADVDGFFELKRGRSDGPLLPAPAPG